MPEPLLTRKARKQLAALPSVLQAAVVETIAAIGADPKTIGKPLLGRLRGQWAARIGNYRVLYTVEKGTRSSRVVVRAIRHRAVVYRTRRQR